MDRVPDYINLKRETRGIFHVSCIYIGRICVLLCNFIYFLKGASMRNVVFIDAERSRTEFVGNTRGDGCKTGNNFLQSHIFSGFSWWFCIIFRNKFIFHTRGHCVFSKTWPQIWKILVLCMELTNCFKLLTFGISADQISFMSDCHSRMSSSLLRELVGRTFPWDCVFFLPSLM